MYKKPIIVFEGIEGSGKTSHLNFVSKYLKKKDIKYLKIREPGGNKNSEKIRNLILDKKINFNRNTDLLLYLAARSENIELIKKNFKKKVILIDRFVDSTIAYQHYGFGVNLKLIKTINKYLIKALFFPIAIHAMYNFLTGFGLIFLIYLAGVIFFANILHKRYVFEQQNKSLEYEQRLK